MKNLWPEFLVLFFFLLSDLLLKGMASAIAGVAAGLAVFTILLFSGRKKPVLILEGLIFGMLKAAGELIVFPGGSIILMELVLGVALLAAAVFHWNILGGMTAGMGGAFLAGSRGRTLSLILGTVFCVHVAAYILLEALGVGNILSGIALFAVLYIMALRLFSSLSKKTDRANLPKLAASGHRTVLIHRGETLGHMVMEPGPDGIATVTDPIRSVADGRFLDCLETCLAHSGFHAVVVCCWNGDELELEMNGFIRSADNWRKSLRGLSSRT